MYLISSCAHQTGQGFDAVFVKVSFVLFFGFSVFQMINERSFNFNLMIGWYIVFLFYGYLSVLWAKSTMDATIYTNTFIQIFGCIICITNRIKKVEDIDKYLKMIVIALLYTILILYFMTPTENWGTERIGTELGIHPNGVAIRFAVGVFISLYFAIHKKKYYYYIFVAAFIIVTMFTASRKGIIMCIMALVLFPMLSTAKNKTGKEFIQFIIRVSLIIVAIFVVYYLVMNVDVFYNTIGKRIDTMNEFANGNTKADGSIAMRNDFIRRAIRIFYENPVLGCGMNNFVTNMREINYSLIAYSHNNFVELLSTLGLIGFSIYYYFIAKLIINGIKLFFKRTREHAINTLLILVLIVFTFISYWAVNYQDEFYFIIYSLIYTNIMLNEKVLGNGQVVSSIKES